MKVWLTKCREVLDLILLFITCGFLLKSLAEFLIGYLWYRGLHIRKKSSWLPRSCFTRNLLQDRPSRLVTGQFKVQLIVFCLMSPLWLVWCVFTSGAVSTSASLLWLKTDQVKLWFYGLQGLGYTLRRWTLGVGFCALVCTILLCCLWAGGLCLGRRLR